MKTKLKLCSADGKDFLSSILKNLLIFFSLPASMNHSEFSFGCTLSPDLTLKRIRLSSSIFSLLEKYPYIILTLLISKTSWMFLLFWMYVCIEIHKMTKE
jgi:hypothetical protein